MSKKIRIMMLLACFTLTTAMGAEAFFGGPDKDVYNKKDSKQYNSLTAKLTITMGVASQHLTLSEG